ncbi:Similar to Ankyrin repeat domain-containing protein 29; acc. no. Q8N6D5 [Pyronema omphalodes CBS 100304]|uniref:Similar to Ankyrin repeat domain-containing protein 29 acc. no. Q8N6D5 n=1 Tax=Pyronema omphalodes (strain CBS 100304) TaxID=1076935 RepID=U4LRI2_PYROM|nr:Similar to Ankyrin repeat domain-containing protein 29; acc. no. Q8N6D5 [Pyronema omphalodes CBS 100304]
MDHERVVKLLLTQSNIEPKTKDKYGCTALMLAIMGGYRSIVKLLLAQDALINACQRDYEGIVRLLLEREDIDVDASDNYGKTALTYAVEGGYNGIATLISDWSAFRYLVRRPFS